MNGYVQLHTIFEGLLVVLDAISLLALFFYCYALYLLEQERRNHDPGWGLGSALSWTVILFAALFASLFSIHLANRYYDYQVVVLALILGWALCAAIYFRKIRPNLQDDRIQYAALLWTSYWILTVFLILYIVWVHHQGGSILSQPVDQQALSQYVNALAQLVGIIIAATMIVVTNRHNAKQADETARQSIYQTLELESIRVFRFEIDHPKVVQALWYDCPVTRSEGTKDKIEAYNLKQHTCQILNLFEMACRFRKEGIIEADIFGSWIIWIWELCNSKAFREQWQGDDFEESVEFNYIEDFRSLINAGIHYSNAKIEDLVLSPRAIEGTDTAKQRMRSFARYAAHQLIIPITEGDPERYVIKWLGPRSSDENKAYQADLKRRYAKYSEPEFLSAAESPQIK